MGIFSPSLIKPTWKGIEWGEANFPPTIFGSGRIPPHLHSERQTDTTDNKNTGYALGLTLRIHFNIEGNYQWWNSMLRFSFLQVSDCCQQSLTRLLLPSFHPSILPPYFFKTHSKFSIQNFQLQIFNANAQHFQFEILISCKIYNFLKSAKFIIFL